MEASYVDFQISDFIRTGIRNLPYGAVSTNMSNRDIRKTKHINLAQSITQIHTDIHAHN